MRKEMVKVGAYDIGLTIHEIEGEVSEVYAYWNNLEIDFAYDLEEMIEKLPRNLYLNNGEIL